MSCPRKSKFLEVEKAHVNITTKLIYYKLTKVTAVAEKSAERGTRYSINSLSLSLRGLCYSLRSTHPGQEWLIGRTGTFPGGPVWCWGRKDRCSLFLGGGLCSVSGLITCRCPWAASTGSSLFVCFLFLFLQTHLTYEQSQLISTPASSSSQCIRFSELLRSVVLLLH